MNNMHPLGALIRGRMATNNWSLDEVVARAVAAGEKLGRSNLHRMQTQPPESLTRSTVFGLAAGLGVTPLSVANAALQSMGIEPLAVEVTDTLATVSADPSLSESNKVELRALIIAMRSSTRRDPIPNFGDGAQRRRSPR